MRGCLAKRVTRRRNIKAVAFTKTDAAERIADALLKLASRIPASSVRESTHPDEKARAIVLKASTKAAMVSGTLALPAGPLGLLTLLPDLMAIWRIQRQLVSDVAAVYGQTAKLSRGTMIYCLFRHAAAQAVRDVVVRAGQRFLVRETSPLLLRVILRRVGVSMTERVAERAASRWIPIIGAVGIGGYAFYDTAQVGKTAVALFQREIVQEGDST